MSRTLIIALYTLISSVSLGQSERLKEITPPVLQQIKTAVNELIPAYKKSLALKELSSA